MANPATLRCKPAYRIIYKGSSGSILKGLRLSWWPERSLARSGQSFWLAEFTVAGQLAVHTAIQCGSPPSILSVLETCRGLPLLLRVFNGSTNEDQISLGAPSSQTLDIRQMEIGKADPSQLPAPECAFSSDRQTP